MKPWVEVREENQCGVEFPGHKKVKAVIERHLAMVYKNHTAGYLPCQNGTRKNPQTSRRCKGTGTPLPGSVAPLPRRSPPPGGPPAPAGDTDGNESYAIDGIVSSRVYTQSTVPNTQYFNCDTYAKDSKHDQEVIPDFLNILSAACKNH